MIKAGVVYRGAEWDDISGLIDLDRRKWGDLAAGRDKWESRMSTFREGTRVAVLEDKIVGVFVNHIVDYPEVVDGRYPTWEEITADGYITNHNPGGNMVYGVNFAVDSPIPKVAYNILGDVIREVARPRGLPWRIGYRAPFVSKYHKEHGAGKLSKDKVLELALEDPIVNRLFFRQGFKLVGVSENYFSRDKASDGWGVIVEVR